MAAKMHPDEKEIDESLVSRLIAEQYFEWNSLPLRRIRSAGTDNAIFRLGDDLAVRLPRIHWATNQVETEFRWLPKLAPSLPFAISQPVAKGQPAGGYPWNWGIYRWLSGETPMLENVSSSDEFAKDLASFVLALQRIETTDAPRSSRGEALTDRDESVRNCLRQLRGKIDIDASIAVWEATVGTSEWSQAPVWIHGDLQSGNLLSVDGKLSSVIDFGCLGVGDPAVDLLPAWNLFTGESRNVYRAALGVDDATWERGKGWALSVALIALPYYWKTNPSIVAASLRTLTQVLTDSRRI